VALCDFQLMGPYFPSLSLHRPSAHSRALRAVLHRRQVRFLEAPQQTSPICQKSLVKLARRPTVIHRSESVLTQSFQGGRQGLLGLMSPFPFRIPPHHPNPHHLMPPHVTMFQARLILTAVTSGRSVIVPTPQMAGIGTKPVLGNTAMGLNSGGPAPMFLLVTRILLLPH
jgi:hypothetical protein